MRHLPNLLTLANLFCGCAAIAFILSAQNFNITSAQLELIEVPGIEQPYWGSIFIGLAAFFDLLDGFAARSLRITSPIGKDLDSLADVVSFGVAPAMILYKMIWTAIMSQPTAMDVSLWETFPAFLVACFAALRLARFNVSGNPKADFSGMPTPAVGLLVASLPLINWQNSLGIGNSLYNKWLLYAIVALLCWLMVSGIRFIKFIPSAWNTAQLWPRLLIVLGTAAAIPVAGFAAIPIGFALYILVSFVAPKDKLKVNLDEMVP